MGKWENGKKWEKWIKIEENGEKFV